MKRGQLASTYFSIYENTDVTIEQVKHFENEYGIAQIVVAELSDGKIVYSDDNISFYLNSFDWEKDIVWDDNNGFQYADGTQLDGGPEIH